METIKKYFQKTELETGTFTEIMRTLSEKVSGEEECNWAHAFMDNLSKAFKFDMTIMFAEDEENEYISNVIGKIRAVDSAKADALEQVFTD